jgi:hypothetical protein
VTQKWGERLRPGFSIKVGTIRLYKNSLVVREMIHMPSREAQEQSPQLGVPRQIRGEVDGSPFDTLALHEEEGSGWHNATASIERVKLRLWRE